MNIIRKANDSDYIGLRSLWAQTFGDDLSEVDDFYANWGNDVEGYILEADGTIASALTLFRMGDLIIPGDSSSKPVYVSYAICTDSLARGMGYGSMITEFAREVVLDRGGVSMLSPAEPSLVKFYQPLDYEPRFYAMVHDIVCESTGTLPAGAFRISATEYNKLREELLARTTHVRLNDSTLRYIEECSDGLYSLLGGKVIIATEKDSGRFPEAIVSDELEPTDLKSAVSAVAGALGKNIVTYRTPGNEYLQSGELRREYVQAMIARDRGWSFSEGYFGFTFD